MVSAALCITVLVSVTTLMAIAAPPEHFLEYSEDNFKAQFISGNLTASMPRDWPSVDFQHSDNMFAPMFEVRLSRIFLSNDTNGDDAFSRSEATYTGFLDSVHTEWNMTSVRFTSSAGGESAVVSMSAIVSLFKGYVEETDQLPDILDWANVTITYTISELAETRSNSFGQYAIAGKTDLQVRMGIDLLKQVASQRLVLEHILLGGGSVDHFLLREAGDTPGTTVLTPVPYKVDERGHGTGFSHRVRQAPLATQDIEFAKTDETIQAYYRFSSEPTGGSQDSLEPTGFNMSYYTTGGSLLLFPSYTLGNDTENIVHDMVIGLDMDGFVRVRDWVAGNLPALAIVCGGLVAVTAASVHVWRGKRRRLLEDRDDMRREQESERAPK